MKLLEVLTNVSPLSTKRSNAVQSPIRVCMHVVGDARTDVRVMREATALTEAGFDVSIIDVEAERTLPRDEKIQGVSVRHIIMPDWFVPTRFKPWFLVKAASMLFRGLVPLVRVPADVYHAHDVTGLPACYIAARLRRKPLIFDSHEMPLAERNVVRWNILHSIAIWFLARMVPYCSGIITVSPPIAQEIHRLYHGPAATLIRNVPVYRVVKKSDLLRQRLGLQAGTRIALYQGAIHPDRGLDMLIRAARFLEQNVVIVILGDGSQELLFTLKALIASEGVADRVKMLPWVPYEELLDWTASADIGLNILPRAYSFSIQMCLPNKFFEYMMAGLPVLSSQLDVVADIIKTYEVGQIVSSLEPAEIGEAINRMLADPLALDRMGRNGQQAVQQEFQWEEEHKKLLCLYQNILYRER